VHFVKAELCDLERIVQLRHRVLHPGGPVGRVLYSEDADPSTLHLVVKKENAILACGTLIDEGQGVYRIRGMAVAEDLRGQGLGSKLVSEFVSFALEQKNFQLLWCNGRVAALGLYERKGFVKSGGVFDVPGSGPHYRLELKAI